MYMYTLINTLLGRKIKNKTKNNRPNIIVSFICKFPNHVLQQWRRWIIVKKEREGCDHYDHYPVTGTVAPLGKISVCAVCRFNHHATSAYSSCSCYTSPSKNTTTGFIAVLLVWHCEKKREELKVSQHFLLFSTYSPQPSMCGERDVSVSVLRAHSIMNMHSWKVGANRHAVGSQSDRSRIAARFTTLTWNLLVRFRIGESDRSRIAVGSSV